ncbi:MAG: hypothetical protein ABI232_09045 [Jatrophihabitantaceae bacterium]
MTTDTNVRLKSAPATAPTTAQRLRTDPAFQVFWALRIGFTALPILMGADKFAHVLTNWDHYYAPRLDWLLPGSMSVHQAMYVVGVIEIVAGLVVLLLPRIGSVVVAAWLVGIMIDLLALGHYGDVALRDFGLFLAALSLARLAHAFPDSGVWTFGSRVSRRP